MSRDRLLQAVNVSQECMGNVFITPLPILKLLKWAREPGMHRMDRSFEEMRSIMTKVIQVRRHSKDNAAPQRLCEDWSHLSSRVPTEMPNRAFIPVRGSERRSPTL